METKAFNNKQFVYFDMPAIKGWHDCSVDEYLAWQPSYNGGCDHDLLHWTGAKIPKTIMKDALGLIKHFKNKEVMVALYYSARENNWIANVPKQKGAGASVSYDSDYKPPVGYGFCGTIHSHPQMSAFWSGTDRNDQCSKNGLHIVVGTDTDGHLNTVLCSLWYNGKCYKADDQVELPAKEEVTDAPEEWVNTVNTCVLEEKTVSGCFKFDSHKWKTTDWSKAVPSSNNKEHKFSSLLDTDEDYFEYLLLGVTDEDRLALFKHLAKTCGMEDLIDVIEANAAEIEVKESKKEAYDKDYYDLYDELVGNSL